MIDVKRLGHAVIETPDLPRQIEHFHELLGLVLVGEERERAFLATPAGQLAVVLERGAISRTTKIAFEVSPGTSVAKMQGFLSGMGVQSDARTDALPGVTTSIAFSDVKGTDIELFADWDFLPDIEPVAESINPLKLGHIAFVVLDPKKTETFYRDVLGFRTSDWIGDNFVFMRCTPDHHTVNFVQGDGPARMHHIAFELRDRTHLFDSCDRLGAADREILWGPLRHGPGHNIATYHHTPDEQVIELYVEMDRIYDEEACYFEPRPWHEDVPQRPKSWARETANMWGLAPSPDWKR
ncbi:VOC family protein [Glaciibacter sp. 2TAF33]|uniref:VOC family protein n=1 Tax=Glaciibacter sp. 2TAF33 TaxID=3233015 RepID=UPI003F8FE9A1